MKAIIAAFLKYQPGKILYARWEWICMRIFLCWALYGSFKLAGYDALAWCASPGRGLAKMVHPRGLSQFLDVSWISQPAAIPWFSGGVALGLLLLMLGFLPTFASGLLLVLLSFLGSYENSSSSNVFHTSQILAFALLGIVLGGVYEHVRALRAGRWKQHLAAPLSYWTIAGCKDCELEQRMASNRSQVIYTVQQMLAAAYVVAGVTKLWVSKGRWISESVNIPLQFLKNQKHEFFETLDPAVHTNWAIEFVTQHPILAKIAMGGSLLMELGCFLALFNRVIGLVLGLAIIFMHVMISLVMDLSFDSNIHMLAIFFVNVPFWLVAAVRLRRPSGHCPVTSHHLS